MGLKSTRAGLKQRNRRVRQLNIELLERREVFAAPTATDDVYNGFEDQQIVVDLRPTAETTAANFQGLRLGQKFAVSGNVLQIEYSSQSNIVALRDSTAITILDATNGAVISTIAAKENLTDFDFSPDGRYLFAADFGGERIGYGTPTRPHWIHRYDTVTNSWITKQAPAIAYKIEAVDSQRFVVLESDQWVDMMLNNFGTNPSDPVQQTARISADYYGDIEFDHRTGRVYHGNNGSSSHEVNVRVVTGSTFGTTGYGTGTYGTASGGGGSSVLSDDGKFFYYGAMQFNAVALTVNQSFGGIIKAATANLAFSGSTIYNALTAANLGSIVSSASAYGYDDDGKSLWVYNNSTKEVWQYNLPGGLPTLLGNDTDADQEQLFTSLVTGPQHGTLTLNPNGTFTYTPNAGYSGTDSFVYEARDVGGASDTATVTLNIAAVNDAPKANPESYSTNEDTPLVVSAALGVLLNDTDEENTPLAVLSASDPAGGTVVVAADGSFIYTPDSNFYGTDTFTYVVSDGNGTATGTVTITVAPVADAPIANADTYSMQEDATLTTSTSNSVVKNDIEPDGGLVTGAVLTENVAQGTLTFNANGTFTYKPPLNFNGPVTFKYKATDGVLLSNEVTVTINVLPVNDAPTVVADKYIIPFLSSSLIVPAAQGVLSNDSDPEGNPITAAVLGVAPKFGTVVLNPDGSFTYTRGANFTLTDSFTYRASDGSATSGTQTVTIELGTARINIGNHTLKANTPNQTIPVYITGDLDLTGLNFRLQIGDGTGGTPEPIVSAISIADTIWPAGETEIIGGPVIGSQQFVQASFVFTESGQSTVSNGKLVTLTVDTTGIYTGLFALKLKGTQIGEDSDLMIAGSTAAVPLWADPGSISVTTAQVTTRATYYNNSYFDDNSVGYTAADESAIATDKVALRPGQTAKFNNYTSYSKGINGIIIDVQDKQYMPSLDEFEFRTGNAGNPATWPLLTVAPTLTTREIDATTTRFIFTWPDNTIRGQWLEVLVKAKGAIGLPIDDVFYFGNAVGESGNNVANAFVDGIDFGYARDNPRTIFDRAPITHVADFNRDSLVNALDTGIVRDNNTNFLTALKLLAMPAHVTPNRTPYVPPAPAPESAAAPLPSSSGLASGGIASGGVASTSLSRTTSTTSSSSTLAKVMSIFMPSVPVRPTVTLSVSPQTSPASRKAEIDRSALELFYMNYDPSDLDSSSNVSKKSSSFLIGAK